MKAVKAQELKRSFRISHEKSTNEEHRKDMSVDMSLSKVTGMARGELRWTPVRCTALLVWIKFLNYNFCNGTHNGQICFQLRFLTGPRSYIVLYWRTAVCFL